MTQTFLISSRFSDTARCLDSKRLNKQITEAFQIYKYLIGRGKMQGNPHPYNMWRGYEKALLFYILAMHDEWKARYDNEQRGGKRTHLSGREAESYVLNTDFKDYKEPKWIRDHRVLSSHRAALLYKNPEYYKQFGWKEKPAKPIKVNKDGSVSLPYFWPDKNKKEPILENSEDNQ